MYTIQMSSNVRLSQWNLSVCMPRQHIELCLRSKVLVTMSALVRILAGLCDQASLLEHNECCQSTHHVHTVQKHAVMGKYQYTCEWPGVRIAQEHIEYLLMLGQDVL